MTSPRPGRQAAAPAQPGQPVTPTSDAAIGARFPASLASPRRARQAVRQVLAAWGLDHLADDAGLLASELIANAVEHGDGRPVDLYLRGFTTPGGQSGISCEVTDTSHALPRPRQAGHGRERGRGLAIVNALSTRSGVTAGPDGKTAWFTLTTGPAAPARQAEPEFEAGA
jgi:anti-sigma regulatory factor (Ser/Thr protein kinase)